MDTKLQEEVKKLREDNQELRLKA